MMEVKAYLSNHTPFVKAENNRIISSENVDEF